MNKKLIKAKGFTLIELILYVGLVAVMSMGIYTIYDKRQTDATAFILSKNLDLIDISVSRTYAVTDNDFSSLNNTFAIASNLIPSQLVSGTTISNMFGGTLSISPETIGTESGYKIEVNNLPSYACTKIATSPFSRKVTQLEINGEIINPPGTAITASQIGAITLGCNNTSNTVTFKNTVLTDDLPESGVTTPIRNKENPNFIATVGDVSAGQGASACTGSGATWNGSFCACPSGTEWSGTSCLSFTSVTPQPGWCPRGQGWLPGSKVCSNLPNAPTAAYANSYTTGRNLSNIISTPTVQTNVGGLTPPPASNIITPEVIAGKTINWAAGQVDDKTIQVCVNGTWNATTRRCVTPVLP